MTTTNEATMTQQHQQPAPDGQQQQQQQQFSPDFFKPDSTPAPDPLAPKPHQQQQQPSQQTQPEPTPSQQEMNPTPGFVQEFQQHFGYEPQQFAAYFQELQSDYHTRVEQQYKQTLKSKFGEEGFEQRYNAVTERFNALPPERQQALLSIGNVEAAILIDNAIRAEKSASGASPTVPTLDGHSQAGANPKREWRMSEIYKMTPQQFKENEAEIDQAAAEGRLIRDA